MTGTSFRYAGQRQPLLDVTSKQRPEMMRSQPPEALGLKKKKKVFRAEEHQIPWS